MSVQGRQLVVVLGMHRSGTSVITRSLAALGLRLGDSLMPAAATNNEKGFWEDLDIFTLNEELLSSVGRSWHSIAPLSMEELGSPSLDNLRRRAVELLSDKVSPEGIYAFKDPRTSSVLSFWQQVFAELGLVPRYVLTVRDPADVASSLRARDSMPVGVSYLLWLVHVLPAIRMTDSSERYIVSYDAMLEAPTEQLEGLRRFLGVESSEQTDGNIRQFCDEFLDASLRHNRGSSAPQSDNAFVSSVAELYRVLDGAAGGSGEKLGTQAIVRQLDELLDACAPMLACIDGALSELVGHASVDAEIGRRFGDVSELKREYDETCLEFARFKEVFQQNAERLHQNAERLHQLEADLQQSVETGRELSARLHAVTSSKWWRISTKLGLVYDNTSR